MLSSIKNITATTILIFMVLLFSGCASHVDSAKKNQLQTQLQIQDNSILKGCTNPSQNILKATLVPLDSIAMDFILPVNEEKNLKVLARIPGRFSLFKTPNEPTNEGYYEFHLADSKLKEDKKNFERVSVMPIINVQYTAQQMLAEFKSELESNFPNIKILENSYLIKPEHNEGTLIVEYSLLGLKQIDIFKAYAGPYDAVIIGYGKTPKESTEKTVAALKQFLNDYITLYCFPRDEKYEN